MKKIYATVMMATAALLLASAAHAQVTLNSARVGGQDTAALAKFYESAFGMFEVNRITRARRSGNLLELRLVGRRRKGQQKHAHRNHASRFRRTEGPDCALDL